MTDPNRGGVIKVGYYHPSRHNASVVISPNGIAPTVMENHGTITAVIEYAEEQKIGTNDGKVLQG